MLKLETKADLEALIAEGERESLTLEFKAGAAIANEKKGEIGKDVSAMANAAGGQIIYGIKERDHVAAEFKPVDNRRFNHEWLEKVIRNNISPAVDGLIIKMIDIGPGSSDVAFVVTIPPATVHAPHQATEYRKYFRRHNFAADPMADYEVREAMRRTTRPILEAKMGWLLADHSKTGEGTRALTANIVIENASSEPALYTAFTIFADDRLQIGSAKLPFYQEGQMEHPLGRRMWGLTLIRSTPDHLPIFRERSLQAGLVQWLLPPRRGITRLALGYRIATPGFSTVQFFDASIDGLDIEVSPINQAAE